MPHLSSSFQIDYRIMVRSFFFVFLLAQIKTHLCHISKAAHIHPSVWRKARSVFYTPFTERCLEPSLCGSSCGEESCSPIKPSTSAALHRLTHHQPSITSSLPSSPRIPPPPRSPTVHLPLGPTQSPSPSSHLDPSIPDPRVSDCPNYPTFVMKKKKRNPSATPRALRRRAATRGSARLGAPCDGEWIWPPSPLPGSNESSGEITRACLFCFHGDFIFPGKWKVPVFFILRTFSILYIFSSVVWWKIFIIRQVGLQSTSNYNALGLGPIAVVKSEEDWKIKGETDSWWCQFQQCPNRNDLGVASGQIDQFKQHWYIIESPSCYIFGLFNSNRRWAFLQAW